ncbi:SusC/RagA family TonB-linked outer membrane protein [Saccharicrinis fermentans]|uniref:TonB-linked outer membrane protein, SusC/RagA family n=1 Tax=Saccharicrinis fermentans DSM 9555 = JCM 21142 TaxID=869213 RepID=W7YR26_9BACT|nr:TonB-dependent receptor [Saccharicrinis fermentans]GAF04884.1 TonB-linked outer membrane protein, SusC/RagA family [Saccharicrinis fermentans DSM 9555 = JCM 21142]
MRKTNNLFSKKKSLHNSLKRAMRMLISFERVIPVAYIWPLKDNNNHINKISRTIFLVMFVVYSAFAFGQASRTLGGEVVDSDGTPVVGATVMLKGSTTVGVITDYDGKFSLIIPSGEQSIVVSFIGMETQEIDVTNMSTLKVLLVDQATLLGETIVVGYGQQKKESVVGAITQTTGKVLERSAGVSNVGSALTGNLPGVTTMASSGMPGEEDPMIIIRSASSWNNSEPLILVDGVQRPMSTVDVGSVQSISVLKDASATAVYGVQGANGVILITTKRGNEGSARIDVSVNSTMKVPSKLPNKLDAYDALIARNIAIEHELGISPDSWNYIRSQDFIDNYRNQTTLEQKERYPNVDWQDALFKDYAMAYNANVNVSGGSESVKYFTSVDFTHEGDLFKVYDNGRGYDGGYGYNRLNVRSNLDFQLAEHTFFSMNLAGSTGYKKTPWDQTSSEDWGVAQQWAGAYRIAPDVFLPKYADGSWGFYPDISNVSNSAQTLSISGAMLTTTTRINTDFVLKQDLDFITHGLGAKGTISWDNNFVEYKRGVNDLYNDSQSKYIDPQTGLVTYKQAYDPNNFFDFAQPVLWKTEGGEVRNSNTLRNMAYQLQLDWNRTFGQHSVTAMGLFSRKKNAVGSIVPIYREDWAFRTTYNWASKYFLEYNGAYNGSEKFGKEYRFGFFNSGAIGWMVSEESFMQDLSFLDMLKVRASYGEIGDDYGPRFMYMTQWALGGGDLGHTPMGLDRSQSSYTWYRETGIGNPDVSWETVRKLNVGVDYAFLGGLVAGNFEYFEDKRVDILIDGKDRAVPSYFGNEPPTANMGEVHTHGFELELRINKKFVNGLRVWADMNMTQAKNKIVERDDAYLLPDYQKQAGFSIDQSRLYVDDGFLNNYDQLYGSPQHSVSDDQRLPGDYYIIDFNGDGVIDINDQIPYGYSNVPQNTYNGTLGLEWKGFSAFVQFYGVNNVSRSIPLTSFGSGMNTVYDLGTWWSQDHTAADITVPRYYSKPNSAYNQGTQYLYDGSYIRLKNAEIAYTFSRLKLSKVGLSNMKIYVNGNNLWVSSKMPDDRESNFAGSGEQGAYPTMKRYCLGVRFTL